MENNHVEAWKSVIEFTKVIVSLSTSILTILIGYITLSSIDFITFPNFIPPAFLVLAIAFSLYGFGRAIPAIRSGNQKTESIFFSNLAALSLTIGILTIPVISVNTKQTIDDVLNNVQKETQSLNYLLLAGACDQVNLQGDIYTLRYPLKEKTVMVRYSTKSREIIFIGENK